MFDSTRYVLRRTWPRAQRGSTHVALGVVDAFIKFDASASPHNVFNEIVALRLAQSLRVPVLDGVLVTTLDGPAYASLSVAGVGVELPDMQSAYARMAAQSYPRETAGLLTFDLWIGNWDRARNLKVSLADQRVRICRGFDHGHALLGLSRRTSDSVKRIESKALLVRSHPFFGVLAMSDLAPWITRIERLTNEQIDECVFHNQRFRDVSLRTQRNLATALAKRRDALRGIITRNRKTVLGR